MPDDKSGDSPRSSQGPHAGPARGSAAGGDWRSRDPEASSEAARYAHPLPSRTLIHQMVAEAEEPPTLDDLIGRLSLRKLSEQEALTKRLVAMVRDGQLQLDKRGGYWAVEAGAGGEMPAAPPPRERPTARPPQKRDRAKSVPEAEAGAPSLPPPRSDFVEGKVSAHKDGYGFVAGGAGTDVFLPPRQMRGIMDGDTARVRVTGEDERGRREGVLVQIIERGRRTLVGRLQVQQGVCTVIPSSPKLPEVIVSPRDRAEAKAGQVVVVELLSATSDRALPTGRVIEILGDHMAPGLEIDAAIRTHNLPSEWPEAAEQEASAYAPTVQPSQIEGRVDLRDLGLVTIDGADARDFDDAVCAEAVGGKKGGWKLWVAIADVSAYVTPGSALDEEASKRGNSVYFPERVIPMLPEALSNGLCSLNPEVDRLCMVCEMRVGPDGEVARSRFFEAVMRSKARLVYEDVAAMLADAGSEPARRRPDLLEPLNTLHEVFLALFGAREKRGAIDFEGGETKFVFGADRKIDKIVPVKRTIAHRLIEECMIAANVEAAKLVDKHKMPAPYRIHESPNADKIVVLREFLAGRGLRLPGGAIPSAMDFAQSLTMLRDRPDAGHIQNVMLRSLMQARYSSDNIGHFGLALSHYAHFTSPIRRYPDLLLHRSIKHVLARGKASTFDYSAHRIEELSMHCSMTERRADEATRDVATWLKCEFMSHRVGEELDGIVTSVAPFGLFVELDGLYVDGLIHVSTLEGDYYEFDSKHQRLAGNRTKRVFALGDRLHVKVARVSIDERRIDLILVRRDEERGKQRPVDVDQGGDRHDKSGKKHRKKRKQR